MNFCPSLSNCPLLVYFLLYQMYHKTESLMCISPFPIISRGPFSVTEQCHPCLLLSLDPCFINNQPHWHCNLSLFVPLVPLPLLNLTAIIDRQKTLQAPGRMELPERVTLRLAMVDAHSSCPLPVSRNGEDQ